LVVQVLHWPDRPKRQIKSEPLGCSPFLGRDTDVSQDLQPTDLNLIVHALRNLPETGPAARGNAYSGTLPGSLRRRKREIPAPPNEVVSFWLVLYGTENHYRPP
jgi:hypothetical protein